MLHCISATGDLVSLGIDPKCCWLTAHLTTHKFYLLPEGREALLQQPPLLLLGERHRSGYDVAGDDCRNTGLVGATLQKGRRYTWLVERPSDRSVDGQRWWRHTPRGKPLPLALRGWDDPLTLRAINRLEELKGSYGALAAAHQKLQGADGAARQTFDAAATALTDALTALQRQESLLLPELSTAQELLRQATLTAEQRSTLKAALLDSLKRAGTQLVQGRWQRCAAALSHQIDDALCDKSRSCIVSAGKGHLKASKRKGKSSPQQIAACRWLYAHLTERHIPFVIAIPRKGKTAVKP